MKITPSSILGQAGAWLRRLAGIRRNHAAPMETARTMSAAAPTDPALQRARTALRQMLDRHPQSRLVFAHLALLEQGLAHMGLRILPRLSLHSLQRVHRQLLTVASEAEARPLLDLLQPVIDAHAAAALPATAPAVDPTDSGRADDFQPSRFGGPEISEVDATTYFEAMRAWQDTLVEEEAAASPPPTAAPAPAAASPVGPLAWQPTAPMTLTLAAPA